MGLLSVQQQVLEMSVRVRSEPGPTTVRATGVVPGGYDRVASTMALRPLLEQFEVDLDSLLAESGLPISLFDHPDNLIPFREGTRLLGFCADRTRSAKQRRLRRWASWPNWPKPPRTCVPRFN